MWKNIARKDKIREDIIQVAYYLANKERQNVLDIKKFTMEDRALWDTLNAIIPSYQEEIKKGFQLAKKRIYN